MASFSLITHAATLALLKSGVPASHPGIVQALRFLRRQPPTKTYSMGCQLLALTATGDPEHLPWIQDLADELVLWESSGAPGRWAFEFRPAMGRLLSAHPAIGPAFNTLYSEIMRGPGSLSRQEREMIATVAAAAQDCYY
jgi:hypothetical protein